VSDRPAGEDPATVAPAFGPDHPETHTPARVPRSIRRTSAIDTARPGGVDGDAVMEGRARDLLTRGDGSTDVSDATVWARVGGLSRLLAEIRTVPGRPPLAELVGAMVGPGFRGRVDRLVTDDRDHRTLLYLLLDDLPGAALVSGYALLHAGAVGGHHDGYLDAAVDQCAGWAAEGGMMQFIRREQRAPVPRGPAAPALAGDDDELAWHALGPLTPHGMRRARRIDVRAPSRPGGAFEVDAFFRDSHVDGDGRESVVHEYGVTATVDGEARTVVDIAATADVLPWAECPAAVVSAVRLVGQPLADLRPWVRRTFTGTSTCTHLNDTLRGLADVDVLIDRLVAAGD
jgi:hypothetical protein